MKASTGGSSAGSPGSHEMHRCKDEEHENKDPRSHGPSHRKRKKKEGSNGLCSCSLAFSLAFLVNPVHQLFLRLVSIGSQDRSPGSLVIRTRKKKHRPKVCGTRKEEI